MSAITERVREITASDDTIEYKLYHLVELAFMATGSGSKGGDYTDPVTFSLVDTWVCVDHYYGSVCVGSNLTDGDVEDRTAIARIFEDIKNRLIRFDKELEETRRQVFNRIFDTPVDCDWLVSAVDATK